MPDEVSGRIQVDITEGGAGVSGGAGQPAGGGAEAQTPLQKKQLGFFQGIFKTTAKFLPLLAVAGGIAMLIKKSKVTSAATEAISEILGAIMDVILMPLMPIFVKIMEAIVPLVPIFARLADFVLTPLVNVLVPILESVITTIEGFLRLFDPAEWRKIWEGLGKWWKELDLWDWVKVTSKNFWDWVTGTPKSIWDWVVTSAKSFWDWVTGTSKTIWEWINPEKKSVWEWITTPIKSIWDFITGWFGSGATRQLGGYVPKTQPYLLHRGEEVLTSSGRGGGGNEIVMHNIWNIGIDSSVSVDEFMTQVESRLATTLTSLQRRIPV